jgi:Ca2+-binding EF-hand superfamily protein
MADDLRRFDYDRETNNGFVRCTRSQASVSSGMRSIKGMALPHDVFQHEDYQVLN